MSMCMQDCMNKWSCFKMVILSHMCWDSWYIIECNIMYYDWWIWVDFDHDMVFRLGEVWFPSNRYVALIFGTCDRHVWAVSGNMLGISMTRQ